MTLLPNEHINSGWAKCARSNSTRRFRPSGFCVGRRRVIDMSNPKHEIIGALTLISKTTIVVNGRFITEEIFAGKTDDREGFWFWRYDAQNKPSKMTLYPGDPRQGLAIH